MGRIIPYIMEHKNVWNHQPVYYMCLILLISLNSLYMCSYVSSNYIVLQYNITPLSTTFYFPIIAIKHMSFVVMSTVSQFSW